VVKLPDFCTGRRLIVLSCYFSCPGGLAVWNREEIADIIIFEYQHFPP